MKPFNKIWSVGLPRSGGQSLQAALAQLLGRPVWHSPGNRWDHMEASGDYAGAVEVFAPFSWLNLTYPDSIFIWNERDTTSWLESCRSVYEKSQKQHYNHPIWRYPLSQFVDYYLDAYSRWIVFRDAHPGQCFEIAIIEYPNWVQLCDLLEIPIPIGRRFPRVDRVKSPIRPYPFRGRPFGDPFELQNLLSPTLEFE